MRELGVSQIQGYIFGRPMMADAAQEKANSNIIIPMGHRFIREPRHRLMRRALTAIDGEIIEVRLRNISSTGALVECSRSIAPGVHLTLDIVGVGPVVGEVRWAGRGQFGIRFDSDFDFSRLAPKKAKPDVTMLRPTYLDRRFG
jgi:hypothetical protein